MAYVPVPKDLTKVKTKVALNLTKRQLICFGSGALIGLPLFFLLRKPLGSSAVAMCMMLAALPCFMLGIYEKHGLPLEKVIRNILRVCFLRPKQRPYRTRNFYAVLERQDQLDKEVYHIVYGSKKSPARVHGKAGPPGASGKPRRRQATVPRGKAEGRGGNRQGKPDG